MQFRDLDAYGAAALGLDTRASKSDLSGAQGTPLTGATNAPAVQISQKFQFQSYFDSNLLQNALLNQPQNEPIVPSTRSPVVQLSGYGVGLHPSSQAPIAITFDTGAQQGASQALRLTPGQMVRPYGSPHGKPGAFSGFRFGLPFGWLGGGSVSLLVLRTPDAQVAWQNGPEIIFHRMRMPVYQPGQEPIGTSLPYNWPLRFPWPKGFYGQSGLASPIAQQGQPALAVSPTRTAMMLRVPTLENPADFRCVFIGSNDFGLDLNGTVITTDAASVDITFGNFAQTAGAIFTQYPTQMFTGQLERFAADDGALLVINNSGNAELDGAFLDCVRYGKL